MARGRKKNEDIFLRDRQTKYIKDEKLQSLLKNFMKKGFAEEEYYIDKGVISHRVMQEHNKGHRPIEHIEKDYFDELGLNVSMRFFKWYLEKYCDYCDCEICGCDKNSCTCDFGSLWEYDAEYLGINFYDIVACGEQLKQEDLKKLKQEYKSDTQETNSKKNTSDEYFYAKVEHFISPTRWEKIKCEDFAIVYRDWAHIKASGKNSKVQIKSDPKEFNAKILKKFYRRPDEMSKEIAEEIINKLSKSNHNLKLAKPLKN